MALRNILTQGDEQLLKHSRKVEKFDARLHTLIDDMRETLENSLHRRSAYCAAWSYCWTSTRTRKKWSSWSTPK